MAHFNWTYEYTLWGVPYSVIQIMLADQPKYESGDPEPKPFESKDELISFINKVNQ